MTNIIEHTYKELANTSELQLTEKDYSTNYLGRCKSYYAYLIAKLCQNFKINYKTSIFQSPIQQIIRTKTDETRGDIT